MGSTNRISSTAVEQATTPRRTAISVDGAFVRASFDADHDQVLVEVYDEHGEREAQLRLDPLEAEHLAGVLQDCHDQSNRAWRKQPEPTG